MGAMRNVQGASLHRFNKVRMAFNLLLKLFNLQLKLHYKLFNGCLCLFSLYVNDTVMMS